MALCLTGIRCLRHLSRSGLRTVRFASSSKQKNSLLTITTEPLIDPSRILLTPQAKKELLGEFKSDQWQTFGWSVDNPEEDRIVMHWNFFCLLGVGIVGISFAYTYKPSPRQLDWAAREAYLVLHERETAGLPPIDRNYIDPALLQLPTDEELGDLDIVI